MLKIERAPITAVTSGEMTLGAAQKFGV